MPPSLGQCGWGGNRHSLTLWSAWLIQLDRARSFPKKMRQREIFQAASTSLALVLLSRMCPCYFQLTDVGKQTRNEDHRMLWDVERVPKKQRWGWRGAAVALLYSSKWPPSSAPGQDLPPVPDHPRNWAAGNYPGFDPENCPDAPSWESDFKAGRPAVLTAAKQQDRMWRTAGSSAFLRNHGFCREMRWVLAAK